MTILTALQGKNDALFKNVSDLYLKPGMRVADVTYGKGNFWKQIDITQYVFLPTDITTGIDCQNLPYKEESLDVVVFDPPYIYNPKATIKESISCSYNVNETLGLKNNKEVLRFYYRSMTEAVRVLADNGFLIVKCQDIIQSGRQCWNHIDIFQYALGMGLYPKDLFILVQNGQPTIRWSVQQHARKNHSYLWVFQKRT